MQSIRSRLSYANVVSTLALFLVLGGATAIAATELGPNSVGTVNLKPQAVTGVKIKPGAVIASRLADGNVTTAKLAEGNVTTGKVANGAVTTDKIAAGAVTSDRIAEGAVGNGKIGNGAVTADKLSGGFPFARVVERIRGTATVNFPAAKQAAVVYPLDNPTFTQPAGETHLYVAAVQLKAPGNCPVPRATIELLMDGTGGFVNSVGTAQAEGVELQTFTAQFSPDERGMTTAAPTSPTEHTFSVRLFNATCTGTIGTGGGIQATGAQIDVIGIR